MGFSVVLFCFAVFVFVFVFGLFENLVWHTSFIQIQKQFIRSTTLTRCCIPKSYEWLSDQRLWRSCCYPPQPSIIIILYCCMWVYLYQLQSRVIKGFYFLYKIEGKWHKKQRISYNIWCLILLILWKQERDKKKIRNKYIYLCLYRLSITTSFTVYSSFLHLPEKREGKKKKNIATEREASGGNLKNLTKKIIIIRTLLWVR